MRRLLAIILVILLATMVLAQETKITPAEFAKDPTPENFMLLEKPTRDLFNKIQNPTADNFAKLVAAGQANKDAYTTFRTKNLDEFKNHMAKPTVDFSKDSTALEAAKDHLKGGISGDPNDRTIAEKVCQAMSKTTCSFAEGEMTGITMEKDGKSMTFTLNDKTLSINLKQSSLKGAGIAFNRDQLTVTDATKKFVVRTSNGAYAITPTKDTKIVSFTADHINTGPSSTITHTGPDGKYRGTYTNPSEDNFLDVTFKEGRPTDIRGTFLLSPEVVGCKSGDNYFVRSTGTGKPSTARVGSMTLIWDGPYPAFNARDIQAQLPTKTNGGFDTITKLTGDFSNALINKQGITEADAITYDSATLRSNLEGETFASAQPAKGSSYVGIMHADFVNDGKTSATSAPIDPQAFVKDVEEEITTLTTKRQEATKTMSPDQLKTYYDDRITDLNDKIDLLTRDPNKAATGTVRFTIDATRDKDGNPTAITTGIETTGLVNSRVRNPDGTTTTYEVNPVYPNAVEKATFTATTTQKGTAITLEGATVTTDHHGNIQPTLLIFPPDVDGDTSKAREYLMQTPNGLQHISTHNTATFLLFENDKLVPVTPWTEQQAPGEPTPEQTEQRAKELAENAKRRDESAKIEYEYMQTIVDKTAQEDEARQLRESTAALRKFLTEPSAEQLAALKAEDDAKRAIEEEFEDYPKQQKETYDPFLEFLKNRAAAATAAATTPQPPAAVATTPPAATTPAQTPHATPTQHIPAIPRIPAPTILNALSGRTVTLNGDRTPDGTPTEKNTLTTMNKLFPRTTFTEGVKYRLEFEAAYANDMDDNNAMYTAKMTGYRPVKKTKDKVIRDEFTTVVFGTTIKSLGVTPDEIETLLKNSKSIRYNE